MDSIPPQQREHIIKAWDSRWEFLIQLQNQVIGFVFTVHGGGVAGMLAYASTEKAHSLSVIVGFVAFSVGLLLIVSYAAAMLYTERHYFREFRVAAGLFLAGKMDWPTFASHESATPEKYVYCEALAWSSGACAVTGILSAAIAIIWA